MKTIAFIVMTVLVAVCTALLFFFERKKTSIKKITLIAVITAISVAGRFIFALTPGFKPVTALVIIAGIYLGVDGGFYCGALTALITNCYFGQGPWTPFQMLVWGMIGIMSGLLANALKKHKWFLIIFGAFQGVAFSLIMDIYSVIWTIGTWKTSVYLIMIGTSLPYMAIYAASNIIFLLLLAGPIGRKLERAMSKCKI